jgi:hypothetical protein
VPKDDEHEEHEEHDHQHHGRQGNRTVGDYARDYFKNWNDFEGSFAEKVRLTIRNRAKAYLVPPIKGCCGHRGQPGC